jgi:NhaP-type Na+/H+ or K+/H+ antiporter
MFPDRDLVIFLTFCVIVATLVGQGLTLPYVVRRLGVMAVSGRTPRRRGPASRPPKPRSAARRP